MYLETDYEFLAETATFSATFVGHCLKHGMEPTICPRALKNLFICSEGTWGCKLFPIRVLSLPYISFHSMFQTMPFIISAHFPAMRIPAKHTLFSGGDTDFILVHTVIVQAPLIAKGLNTQFYKIQKPFSWRVTFNEPNCRKTTCLFCTACKQTHFSQRMCSARK